MKKLVLSLAIASTLGLTACDDETVNDVKKDVAENGTAIIASARVVYDPSNGVLSVPNDLLFSGTTDGTLNMPSENLIDEMGNPIAPDYADPQTSLGVLDGWSTVNPFVINLDFPDGISLDANSVFNSSAVKVFEMTMGGSTSDADCTSVPRGIACKVVSELTFGVDFIAQASGNNIAIVPLKPLKAKTTYILALTDHLQDDLGRSVAGSTTYELVKQDINTNPLGSDSQLLLQGMINSFENALDGAGVDKSSVIYTMAMTTQSTTDVSFTLKSLLAAPLAQGGMPPVISVADTTLSVAQAFAMQGIELTPETTALYSTANLYAGSVTLPYYSGIPMSDNAMAPVNDWWRAQCDSGATLAGMDPATVPAGPLDANDGFCMAFGLRDLSSVVTVDPHRHLTQYNPIPKAKGASDIPYIPHPGNIDVQMTVPDISPTTDAVRAGFGLPPLTAEPENGWPVVMLQHGITSKKEDMLAITGVLSAFGFATVAIDHPLHGSRGFDLDNDGTDDINTSTVSATHYMNLANLPTTRDNLRQSTSDMLGLRLGLNALVGANIDVSQVHFLGHSLGAITGINFVTLANTPLNPLLDGMFKITSASLAMPGVMAANFLMESGAFGDVIKSGLTYVASEDFQAYVGAKHPNGASEAELVVAYQEFYAMLSPEQQAGLEGTFAQFTFAAQSVTEAGDPVNYIGAMAATQTPTHLIEVVGNGVDNLPDQVIPNTVSSAPFAGTEGVISLLGLPGVSESTAGSGAVRFLNGHHSSILSPSSRAESPDPEKSARATQEMQGQVAGFFFTGGAAITVTDTEVVK